MSAAEPSPVSAEVVVPTADLDADLAFFTDRLGFDLDLVYPADRPRVAVVSGHGTRLRLDADIDEHPVRLRLLGPVGEIRTTRSPGGTLIDWAPEGAAVELPPLGNASLEVVTGEEDAWSPGRAGMHYQDLSPLRQGGRFIASRIRIEESGPVADYVHYHLVRFQLIYCWRGWVRVVYEDQGPSFVLEPGDCVLQPPGIRHRVLEACRGLEVIEVSSPAEHLTRSDREVVLPTGRIDPERDFGGQRFVHFQAAKAVWTPHRLTGFEAADTGIAEATRGLAGVSVVRPGPDAVSERIVHDGEFLFLFVLSGQLELVTEVDEPRQLGPGAAATIPRGQPHRIRGTGPDLRWLEVRLPAILPDRP